MAPAKAAVLASLSAFPATALADGPSDVQLITAGVGLVVGVTAGIVAGSIDAVPKRRIGLVMLTIGITSLASFVTYAVDQHKASINLALDAMAPVVVAVVIAFLPAISLRIIVGRIRARKQRAI
jgi:hypothetical protein